jgi:ribosomal protein L6P/L9E
MSRIGKKAIDIPKDVSVEIKNEKIIIKGKHGSLERVLLKTINLGPNISTENINIGHSKAAVRVNSSLAILGNLYLSGDFKTNGDAGEVGEVQQALHAHRNW